MVKGKTKSGIKFQLDERIKDDTRFLYYLSKIQDEKLDVGEQSKAIIGVLMLIFGNDEGVINFMNTVASTNGGICSGDVLISELSEIFDALNTKNLLSSPQS